MSSDAAEGIDPRTSAEFGIETVQPTLENVSDYRTLLIQNIHSLAQRGDLAAIDHLLISQPSLVSSRDVQDVTPLHWAAINAHMGVCRLLLDRGADVDPVGGELRATPLQWAARNGHLYVIHLLLSRGADPNIRDAQGFNTLHLITHSSTVMPVLYIVSCACVSS